MSNLPECIQCGSANVYEYSGLYNCPDCGHEWSAGSAPEASGELIVKDANGTILKEGDTVTVIKDLKVKGSSTPLKAGTKIKNIHLVDGDHNVDCRIPGVGAMGLKSEFLKKVN